jgi:hypothetical protein
VGKPTELTPEDRRAIVADVAAGLPLRAAVRRAGIRPDPALKAALRAAEAALAERMLAVVERAAAAGNKKAARWLARRREAIQLRRELKDLIAALAAARPG